MYERHSFRRALRREVVEELAVGVLGVLRLELLRLGRVDLLLERGDLKEANELMN